MNTEYAVTFDDEVMNFDDFTLPPDIVYPPTVATVPDMVVTVSTVQATETDPTNGTSTWETEFGSGATVSVEICVAEYWF